MSFFFFFFTIMALAVGIGLLLAFFLIILWGVIMILKGILETVRGQNGPSNT